MKRTKVINVQSLYSIIYWMITDEIGSFSICYSVKCISIALVSITFGGILYLNTHDRILQNHFPLWCSAVPVVMNKPLFTCVRFRVRTSNILARNTYPCIRILNIFVLLLFLTIFNSTNTCVCYCPWLTWESRIINHMFGNNELYKLGKNMMCHKFIAFSKSLHELV